MIDLRPLLIVLLLVVAAFILGRVTFLVAMGAV